ncbi:MAG TPA: transglycosylase SLT domain-containing protein [Blastocatellia bacterium]|nr:transglycosylase SLT domain-containing protein [Blastocatellia bacterium]
MRLTGSGRSLVLILFAALILQVIIPVQAAGQSKQEASSSAIETIIERAESSYLKGEAAFTKSQLADARAHFNEAIDAILTSGIDLRANSRFESYYRDLLNRIHKFEAAPGDDHSHDLGVIVTEPEKVEPALLDELANLKEEDLATVAANGTKIYGSYDFDFSVAEPVLQYINYFAYGRGRSTMEAGLQRSGRYRQMAEKIFKEERVPLDLIWLAQAESVWKPNALSRAAAKGIWQFIPGTGSRFGLNQTTWVDERSHPEKSTRAAARYLRWLHGHFAGDWLLAMAAYNSGEGRVASAIARCGYADFWELHRRGLLPQETRNYVPIILAITIISKNQKRYGLNVQPDPPLNYDTFELNSQTDLKVVADLLSLPYESIRDLNPELRRGVSPPSERYTIKLPKGTRKQFEVAFAALPEEQRVRKIAIPAETIAESARPAYRTRVVSYRARRGDTLSSLARRHGVSVAELAQLNGISARSELRKGQSIRIPQTVRAAAKSKSRSGKYVSRHAARSAKAGRSVKRAGKAQKSAAKKHSARR